MRLLRLVLLALLTRVQYSFTLLESRRSIREISKNGRTTEKKVFTSDSSCQTDSYQHILKQTKIEFKGELKFARTVIFTVERINRNSELLPDITLGYRIYNGCGTKNLLKATLAAVTQLRIEQPGKSCTVSQVQALIGHSSSGPSREISKIISPFSIPLNSHLAICDCLSNRNIYSTFFRTVPSDYFQIRALVELMKHFGWTWVGVIHTSGAYSEQGSAAFVREANEEGICIEYIQRFSRTYSQKTTRAIAQMINDSTSKVALAFMSKSYFRRFLERMEGMNVTGIQWIGSEAWITTGELLTEKRAELLQGAMGFAITESHIPGLTEFLLSLHPSDAPDSTFLRSFWETVFDCSRSVSQRISTTLDCTCAPLPSCQALNNVLRAVLAMARMAHTFVQSHSRQAVYNIHIFPNRNGFQTLQASRSICSESCLHKSKMAIDNRKPMSCFDCTACPHGEINNQRDANGYTPCLLERGLIEDGKQSTFDGRILGFLLTAFFILGVCLTTVAIIVFWYRDHAITRANNSELSFLLLFSLKLCFLCSLTFIGRPSDWSCMLRHTAFGITFVLCISCVLGKTIVVLMAIRATLPGSNVMMWFGPLQQRLSVLALTLIQVLICVLWLTISPPFPNKNMKHYKEKIILECDVGSMVGVWAVLGYIGLLSVLCFVLAFLARKLPFGEYTLLSFYMFICQAVWIAFIQMCVRSPTKYTLIIKIVTASNH